jgi:ribosomal protein L11 methyltransferase
MSAKVARPEQSGAWIEVQIETSAPAAEIVAAAATSVAGGVELRDAETVFPTPAERSAVIVHCRPDEVDELLEAVHAVIDGLRATGTDVDPVAVRRRDAHEQEWIDVWKQFFRATRVGRRFTVRPSWDPGTTPLGEHVIDIDPGRAFGTGAHPSTRLVIALCERLHDENAAIRGFLDLGCGSGILSIVAARLWPEARGLAVDIDPESAACAGENLAANHVSSVEVAAGGIERAGGVYDLVVANIQADVLVALAPEIAGRLDAAGGSLILSGLLTRDVAEVSAAFTGAGLEHRERLDEGEWAALSFGKTRA